MEGVIEVGPSARFHSCLADSEAVNILCIRDGGMLRAVLRDGDTYLCPMLWLGTWSNGSCVSNISISRKWERLKFLNGSSDVGNKAKSI